MYYLNDDGSLDTTMTSESFNCNCDLCRRKRKRVKPYDWFCWNNIMFLLIMFVALLLIYKTNIVTYVKNLLGTNIDLTSSSASSSKNDFPSPTSGTAAAPNFENVLL